MKLKKVLTLILSLTCVSTALPTKNHGEKVTCDKKKYILDSDRNYLKTACIIFSETSHGEACNDVGKHLFIIDSVHYKGGPNLPIFHVISDLYQPAVEIVSDAT